MYNIVRNIFNYYLIIEVVNPDLRGFIKFTKSTLSLITYHLSKSTLSRRRLGDLNDIFEEE